MRENVPRERAVRAVALAARGMLACVLAAAPAAAKADPARDKAAAESLFEQGKSLLEAGNIADACAKLTESLRLDRALGTMINLARCHELEGRTATAWAEYKEVSVLADKAGQAARAHAAATLAARLEPTLSKLRIAAPNPVPGLVVRRDGIVVGPGAFEAPVAVDPGEHMILASAPGYVDWSTTIDVGRGGDERTVAIPALVKAPPNASARSDGDGSRASSPVALRTAGFVVGGLGVVGLGIGIAFGVMTLNEAAEAESDPSLCPTKTCTTQGRAAIDAADTKATVATVATIAGTVALAAGVVLVVKASMDARHQSGALEVRPWIGPERAGFGVRRPF